MQKSFLAWKDLNECSEIEYALHRAFVSFTYFRILTDTIDLRFRVFEVFLIRTHDLHNSHSINFIDSNSSVCFCLKLLNDLSTGTDHGTDLVLRNLVVTKRGANPERA